VIGNFAETLLLPPWQGSLAPQRDLFDALIRGKNIILSGDAGSGKTRTFLEIAKLGRENGYRVAVVEYQGSLTGLEREVGRCLNLPEVDEMHSLRNAIYKVANEESFWLLLDNFLGENQAVNHFLRMLAQLSCRIAVNFRNNEARSKRAAYRSIHATEVYRLQPLDFFSTLELVRWAKEHFKLIHEINWERLPQSKFRLPGVLIGTLGLLRDPSYTGIHGYSIRSAYVDFRTRLLLSRGRWGLFQEPLILRQMMESS